MRLTRWLYALPFLCIPLLLSGCGVSGRDNPTLPDAAPAAALSTAQLQPGFYRASSTASEVYLVEAGARWLIPDPETFTACSGGYASLVRTNTQLTALPNGGTIPSARLYPNLHSGTPFVLVGTGTAYVVSGCVKSGIPSQAVYQNLYGDLNWSRIVSVPAAVFNAFPTAAGVAVAPSLRPGTMIQGPNGGEVRWVLHNGATLGIPSPCALESHERHLWEITRVSSTVFNAYPSVGVLPSYNLVCDNVDLNSLYLPYSGYMATLYAKFWATRPYGTAADQNAWPVTSLGNLCTAFVSEAITAGLIRRTDASAGYGSRYRFPRGFRSDWWFYGLNDRGTAFAGARELYAYAVLQASRPMRPGIQFSFVTSYTRSGSGGGRDADYGKVGASSLWYAGIMPGDVVFFDWTGDGTIDHAMMVVEVRASAPAALDRVVVAGQTDPTSGKGLEQIRLNPTYNQQNMNVFIYRPTGYVSLN